ncbi:MAG: hypothetical protein MMC23_005536 [Stictis urceolatum]|nr:hypothetical protein [Stictis urceolata]
MSQDMESMGASQHEIEKGESQKRKKSEKKKKRKHIDLEDQSEIETSSKKRPKSQLEPTPISESTGHDTDHNSSFSQVTASLYLTLSPISHIHPLNGICAEHLSPLILTFYPPLKGVVLSYRNARLSESLEGAIMDAKASQVMARSIDEFAVSFVWVTAEFLLFKPQRGRYIEGWINLQNESHVGLLCWNLFNASIERKRLPHEWKWNGSDLGIRPTKKLKQANGAVRSEPKELESEDAGNVTKIYEGHFEDGAGTKIEGHLRFRIKDIETSHSTDKESAFISVEGTLISQEEETELMEQEAVTAPVRTTRNGRATTAAMSNATMSGARPSELETSSKILSASKRGKNKNKD